MLIFLDIDGVLVPAKGWKCPELLSDGFPIFSKKATGALQGLISEDAIVMLTTSHKSNFSLEEWKNIFAKRGIIIENLQILPANDASLTRKDEILNWVNLNGIHGDFLIIDDDKSLNDLPALLKANLIQTSPYIGLTEENIRMVSKTPNRVSQIA